MKYVAKEQKVENKKRPAIHRESLVAGAVLVLLLIGLGYSLWQGQQELAEAETAPAPTSASVAKAPSLPVLKLNQNHRREGPVIQVNQDNLGRNDPFLQP